MSWIYLGTYRLLKGDIYSMLDEYQFMSIPPSPSIHALIQVIDTLSDPVFIQVYRIMPIPLAEENKIYISQSGLLIHPI